jgi:hypothetical protein
MKISAISFKSVSGSALAHGCSTWRVRKSIHSFTGSVISAVFSEFQLAANFARRWAVNCGYRFCAVRRVGSSFSVSVPVEWAKSEMRYVS